MAGRLVAIGAWADYITHRLLQEHLHRSDQRGKQLLSERRSPSQGLDPGHSNIPNHSSGFFGIQSRSKALCATEHLVEYFKEGLAQWEVNESNPKGYKGNLVARFDKLINDLTNGNISAFAPTELRAAIAKKNPDLCQAGQQQETHAKYTLFR